MTTEHCGSCGFVWATVPASDISRRARAGSARIGELLVARAHDATTRPSIERWSALEYGAHVRDVLLHLRDRFVIALVEDNPTFKPLYRNERVALGLYRDDDVHAVAAELGFAANLFGRTFDVLDANQLQRLCEYAYPTLQTRTLLWMGQQVVHEVEHHLTDVIDDLGDE